MEISLLAYVATFSEQLCFQRSYFFSLLQSSTFGTRANFLEQLFLQSSCFFEELRFQNSPILAAVIFSEQLLFQSKTSMEQPLRENRKFFRAVTFQNRYFFVMEFFKMKIPTEELLFSNRFCTASTFFRRATIWKKLIFQKRNILHQLPFLQKSRLLFYFFKSDFLMLTIETQNCTCRSSCVNSFL